MIKNTHRSAVDAIAGWIVGGSVAAGAALPTEPEAAARLGISRTIVREAVKTLVAKGLVSTGPRVGTRARAVDQWNMFDADVIGWRLAAGVDADFVRDLMELRLVIEPSAAALAAGRAKDADIACISAAFEAMGAGVEGVGSFLEADLAFHKSILRATHNQFFAGLVPVVDAVLRVSFKLSVKNRDSARSSLPLHQRVLAAIAAGDADAAGAAMNGLISSARRDIESDMQKDGFLMGDAA
jgi:DNA-binding FadR family transcriptional regulator